MKSEFDLGKDPKRIVKTRKLHQLPIDTRKTGWKQDIYYNPKQFRSEETRLSPAQTSKTKISYATAGKAVGYIFLIIASAVFWRYIRTH